MRLRLGINTCFAVKRWPRPADWAPIVRERLGLDLVQHSLDLVDLDVDEAGRTRQAGAVIEAARANGLELHSTFTGLAAYSRNLLLDPDASARQAAQDWYRRAIAFTATIGAAGTGGHVGAFSVADWVDHDRRAERWADLRGPPPRPALRRGGVGPGVLPGAKPAGRRGSGAGGGGEGMVAGGWPRGGRGCAPRA